MRKFFLCLLLTACASDMETLEVSQETKAIAPGSRPNVVVIMTDDLDKESMEVMLELGLAPNIKRIRDEGTNFPNYFISNTLCCPSRATALSGQYSHNNGVMTGDGNDAEGDGGVDAFNDTSTLVTWLQSVGYYTGHIGKYLNGYGTEKDETTPSYQEEYIPPGWNRWMATIGSGTYRMFRYKIHDSYNGVPNMEEYGYTGGVQTENYQTTILAQKTVSFLEEAADLGNPFYLEVMPVAPHAEALPKTGIKFDLLIRWDPQDDIDKPAQMALIDTLELPGLNKPSFDFASDTQMGFVKNRPPLTEEDKQQLLEFHHSRLKSMLAVDDLVGDVLTTLEDRGILENTVIFFTADNGFLLGEHRLSGKRVAFDESTNVPLYVRVPDRDITTTPRYIVNVDLAPTIADLAGATPGLVVDGRSMMPFLSEEVPAVVWRRRAFLQHWANSPGDIPTYAGLRTPKWLFVHYYNLPTVRWELYDLTLDPYQTVNIYSEPGHAAVINNLQDLLDRNKVCVGVECHEIEAE